MKQKFILQVIILILPYLGIIHSITGQSCTPDIKYKIPGVYPNQMETAVVGKYYEQALYSVVPMDTIVKFNNVMIKVAIKYSEVIEVKGLPAGFKFVCNPLDCKMNAGTIDCLLLYGTPTASQTGQYPLMIRVKTYGTIVSLKLDISQVDTIVKYQLQISDKVSIEDNLKMPFLKVIYPIPAKKSVSFHFNIPIYENLTIRLFDVFGNVVQDRAFKGTTGDDIYEISLNGIRQGIYFYKISTKNYSQTGKILID